ncbi:DUF1273 domain-containing protein [Anoxybacteroides tepidamans]|uniref:DUF1273 domain-containing protein n=1 Tax=Anoxybacteroides tepidamans TaxID=265948 RepID=UPI0004800C8D|nr:DUF1273 domain-containing protein [Anoxybacillus tepidamans]
MLKILAVTGYKPYELNIFANNHPAVSYIKKAIQKHLIELLDEGLEWVVISGQLGVELWTAEVVYELQETYPHLQLAVLAPFENQEERWREDNREYYEFIISQADFFDCITKRPYESPAQFRLKNEFIIAKSEGLLIVYDEEKEGTPKFMLQTARKKEGYPIFVISFADLQAIIEEEQMSQWEIDNR